MTENEAQVMTSNNFARTYEAGALEFNGGAKTGKKRKKPIKIENFSALYSSM